jgi:hypothetical protein
VGWTGPDKETNRSGSVYQGSVDERFGGRKPRTFHRARRSIETPNAGLLAAHSGMAVRPAFSWMIPPRSRRWGRFSTRSSRV